MTGKSGEVFVYNETKRILLAFRVRVADSTLGRFIGLGERESLKPGEGLWLVPANPIHIVWVGYAFDVVRIDKDFRVVSMSEVVKPFRVILPKSRTESVIELAPHTIFRSRTKVGDQLRIDSY